MVRPFKRAPGGYTHLLVTIDKFTKWIEAWSISTIKSEQAVLFFLDIIHDFGVPNSIIMDNGMQFTGKSSSDSAMNTTSVSNGPSWRTPAQTGRSSTRMTWSYKASSLRSSIG